MFSAHENNNQKCICISCMLLRWYTHTLLHFKQTMVQVKSKLNMKRSESDRFQLVL